MFLRTDHLDRLPPLRRVSYRWRLVWLSAAWTGVLCVLQLMPLAAGQGILTLVFGVALLALALIGAGLMRAGAQRSKHIDNTTVLTILSCIPIVSLYLVFKKRDPALEPTVRSELGVEIGHVAMMAGVLWVCALLQDEFGRLSWQAHLTANRLMERTEDPSVRAELLAYQMQNQDRGRWLRFGRYGLTDLQVQGTEVHLIYGVPADYADQLDHSIFDTRFKDLCASPVLDRFGARGVTATMIVQIEGGEAAARRCRRHDSRA